jgi:hypothetical protein
VEETALRLCRDKVNFIRSFLENNGEVCADICGFKYRTRGLHLLPATVALIGGENFRRRLASRTPRAMDRPLVLAECRLKIERLEKARSGVSGGSPESAGLEAMAALL